MTTTPISKSKLKLATKGVTDVRKEADLGLSTPHKNTEDGDSDYSPIYFPLTQETNEEIDVLWDWHSPQSTHRKRRKQKRLMPVQSPKFPLKRHPSNNQNQNFERLKNELKALQDELALPDDESCLCVSPQQEVEFKRVEGNDIAFEPETHPPIDEFNDMFDDSLDEQLVIFSQTIENEIKTSSSKTKCDSINEIVKKYSDKNVCFNDTLNNYQTKVTFSQSAPKASSQQETDTQRNIIQTASGIREFHRTKSFELAGLNTQTKLTRIDIEEIERKRLEAKAKLEAKRQKNAVINPLPVKCSPEEIEKKRLQALAKLEAKRLQDIVEKNRQEALKKLQKNRLKNASQVRSTLTTRL